MLGVQPAQTRSLCVLQSGQSPLAADLLQPDVENEPLVAGPADHGSQHTERQVKIRAYGLVVGIHQQVRSSLDLGDSGNSARYGVSAGPTRTHNFNWQAVRPDEVGGTDQLTHCL